MSTVDDLLKGSEIAEGSLPVLLVLIGAITKIVNAKDDAAEQLNALETAAEAIKLRADQLLFPDEQFDAEQKLEPGAF